MTNSSEKRKKRTQRLKTLKNRSILLGVTGGIAAYKSVDLVRRLREKGASVVVVMTGAASKFVAPLALEVASGNKVHCSLFDDPLVHIKLPDDADLMIVAPATANVISKFANGIADDLLTTCFLAYRGKVIVAPSMNWKMYENVIFQENLRKLMNTGFVIQTGPERGELACGEEGIGRMSEPQEIVEAAAAALLKKDLSGDRFVVTAGPTREYFDPVRFISNRSSGKMGFAVARAARDRGAEVTLISGPTALTRPAGIKFIGVETGREMFDAVNAEADAATVLVMAAAVADFSPVRKSGTKMEKKAEISVNLRRTVDIVSSIANRKERPFILGFAAETGPAIEKAAAKMKQKKMDMIVFNDVTEPGAGFDVDTNRVVIIDKEGKTHVGLKDKASVAAAILDRMVLVRRGSGA